jgi:hypothetical protein
MILINTSRRFPPIIGPSSISPSSIVLFVVLHYFVKSQIDDDGTYIHVDESALFNGPRNKNPKDFLLSKCKKQMTKPSHLQ